MASAGTQEEATSGPLVSDSVGLLPTPPPMTGKPGEEALSPNLAPTFSGRKLSLSSLSFVEISPKHTQVCQENQGQAGLRGPWQPRCGPWDKLLTQTLLSLAGIQSSKSSGESCLPLPALGWWPCLAARLALLRQLAPSMVRMGRGLGDTTQLSPRFKGPLHGHHPGNQTACPSEVK